ncbi:hypothetical protein [Ralstonia pseudosolanacearum]
MQQRLFTALSVWTVARKRQLAAWRGGFMQQRRLVPQGSNIRQSGLCGHADGNRAASSAYLIRIPDERHCFSQFYIRFSNISS